MKKPFGNNNDVVELSYGRPLLYSYNGKEAFDESMWVMYETLILKCKEKTLQDLLTHIAIGTLNNSHLVIRISDINQTVTNNLYTLLSKSEQFKVYPSRKNKYSYIPGSIISIINRTLNLTQIFDYWGSVDLFQIISVEAQNLNSILNLLDGDVYTLSVKNLLSILKMCNFVLRDSGDGDEAEIIYPKKDHFIMKNLIHNSIMTKALEISEV